MTSRSDNGNLVYDMLSFKSIFPIVLTAQVQKGYNMLDHHSVFTPVS